MTDFLNAFEVGKSVFHSDSSLYRSHACLHGIALSVTPGDVPNHFIEAAGFLAAVEHRLGAKFCNSVLARPRSKIMLSA
jgi:hypothetical protein